MFEKVVEYFSEVSLEFLLDLGSGQIDQVVVGEEIATDPNRILEIQDETAVEDRHDLPQVQHAVPLLLLQLAPDPPEQLHVLALLRTRFYRQYLRHVLQQK